MTSDALTYAGKHVTPNMTCAHSQGNTKDSIFRLAQGMLCVKMLHNVRPFVGPNVISDGSTHRLSIRQFNQFYTLNGVLKWHVNVSKGDNYIHMLQNVPELHALTMYQRETTITLLQGAKEFHALSNHVSNGDKYYLTLHGSTEWRSLHCHVSNGDNYYLTLQGPAEWHALPSGDCLTVSHESLDLPRQRHELWWGQPLQETVLLNGLALIDCNSSLATDQTLQFQINPR